MSVSKALLMELDQEMARTRSALERVPEGRLDWRPHEKSFTMGDLANHLARLPGWGTETVNTSSLDLDPPEGGVQAPPIGSTVGEILEIFDQQVRRFRNALEEAGDDPLWEPWTLLLGGRELFTLPRYEVLRGMIMNHIVHHRGQLTVYLRLNDVPVPAIYGPSADEEMGNP